MSGSVPSGHFSLLEQVRGLLERSYDHRTACLGALAPFILGDEGYRRLVSSREVVHSVGAGATGLDRPGARLLVRETSGGDLCVNLYYPDHLIRTLESCHPARGLDERNVDAFATFVEEVDHLLLLASRAHGGPPLTMMEMELHANVSKELVLRHFLARLGKLRHLPSESVTWLRFHLFEKRRFSDADLGVRQRYEDATRYAVRYLRHLEHMPPRRRLRSLRRFSRMSQHDKLRDIALAA